MIQQLLSGIPWYDQLEEMTELKEPAAPKKAKVPSLPRAEPWDHAARRRR